LLAFNIDCGSIDEENKSTLGTLVLKYAPYVQALCGAILEMSGVESSVLKKISDSINPVTEYNIPISEAVLPNKKKWRIK
jgi:hypothetical protein